MTVSALYNTASSPAQDAQCSVASATASLSHRKHRASLEQSAPSAPPLTPVPPHRRQPLLSLYNNTRHHLQKTRPHRRPATPSCRCPMPTMGHAPHNVWQMLTHRASCHAHRSNRLSFTLGFHNVRGLAVPTQAPGN